VFLKYGVKTNHWKINLSFRKLPLVNLKILQIELQSKNASAYTNKSFCPRVPIEQRLVHKSGEGHCLVSQNTAAHY